MLSRDGWFGVLRGATVAAVLFMGAWKFASCQDDAFIYFRYADNFVHGRGLVFNGGDRVEGFTSPLWMLLLVVTSALHVPPLLAAGVLGTLSAAAVVLVSVDDARRCGPPGLFAALAPVALTAWIPLHLWAASGLETCLFTALLFAAFASYRASIVAQRPPGAFLGALLALALLARPEGALAVLAIGAAVAVRRDARSTAAVLVPPLVAAALVVAARAVYYRDVLPNPFYAKLGGTLQHAVLGARYVARFAVAVPLAWFLPALLSRRARASVPGFAASAAFLVLWLLHILRTGGDYFQYFRFMVPVAPLVFALGAHGASQLCERLGARWSIAAPCAIAAGVVTLQYDPIANHPQHGLEWTTRWAKLGRTLGRVLPPGTTVAAPNIGAVGYYSRLPIVDLLGLVDRDLARRPRTMRATEVLGPGDVGHDRFDVDWSMQRAPQVLVFMHAASAEPFTDPSEIPADLWVERRLLAYLGEHPGYKLVNLPFDTHQYWGIFIRQDLRLPMARD